MNASASESVVARRLPNLLSSLRLLAVPVLVGLTLGRRQEAFGWLLIAALLTDIADGWIARAFSTQSQRGALLDSVADAALMFVAIWGVWVFHREVITEHLLLCGSAVGLWAAQNALALARYGRLSSYHTYLSKIAANALGVFIGVLFVFGFERWLFQVALGASILDSLEELVLLRYVREWRTDVRGLWWVLRERRVKQRRSR